MAPLTQNKTQKLHSALQPRPYPWLLYCSGLKLRAQTFWTMPENKQTYSKKIPQLSYKSPQGSYFGWCLFADGWRTTGMVLWNSFNSKIITLPPLRFDGFIDSFVLSSNPSDPNCTIFLISDAGSHSIITCQLERERQWVVVDFKDKLRIALLEYEELDDDDDDDDDSFIYNPVFCDGNLYAMSESGRMLLIDSISIKALPIVIPSLGYTYTPHPDLVVCEGKILAVRQHIGGIHCREYLAVEIYSLDCTKMILEKVESLSEFVLFLGSSCSVCCPAKDVKNEGGRIYFFDYGNKKTFCYNIEEKSLNILSHLQIQTFTAWIMPQEYSASKTRIPVDDDTAKISNMHFEKLKDDKEVSGGIFFSKLHSDITRAIAERLRLADYCSFRSTCREAKSLISPVFNLELALNRRKKTNSLHPWLVYFESNDIYSLFDPIHGESYKLRLPDQLSGCKICFSIDGWLLLTSASTGLSAFFNPLTNEIFLLPNRPVSKAIFGASSSPLSSNFLLVDIADTYGSTVNSFRLGDTEWTKNELYPNFQFYENSIVFYNGSFYCLGQDGNLGILNLTVETWPTWEILPGLKKPCCSYRQLFLLECDNQLLSVFVDSNGKRVRVFKLNQSTTTWIKVKRIDNYMICISRSSSFSAAVKIGWMENKIFFPRFYGENVVYFSLDTKKFHSFDGIYSATVDFSKTRELLFSGWFEPHW